MTKWTFLYSKLPYGAGWSVAQRPVSLPGWLGREKPQGWTFSFRYVSKGGGWKARPERESGRHSKWSFQS